MLWRVFKLLKQTSVDSKFNGDISETMGWWSVSPSNLRNNFTGKCKKRYAERYIVASKDSKIFIIHGAGKNSEDFKVFKESRTKYKVQTSHKPTTYSKQSKSAREKLKT